MNNHLKIGTDEFGQPYLAVRRGLTPAEMSEVSEGFSSFNEKIPDDGVHFGASRKVGDVTYRLIPVDLQGGCCWQPCHQDDNYIRGFATLKMEIEGQPFMLPLFYLPTNGWMSMGEYYAEVEKYIEMRKDALNYLKDEQAVEIDGVDYFVHYFRGEVVVERKDTGKESFYPVGLHLPLPAQIADNHRKVVAAALYRDDLPIARQFMIHAPQTYLMGNMYELFSKSYDDLKKSTHSWPISWALLCRLDDKDVRQAFANACVNPK